MSPVEGEHRMAEDPLMENSMAEASRSGRAGVGTARKGNAPANESRWGIDRDHDREIHIVFLGYPSY
jgi:hypothetical protein